MQEYILNFFLSWFIYPGLSWSYILVAVGLGLVFGAIWLIGHWLPLFQLN